MVKAIIMLALFFVPITILNSGIVTSNFLLFGLFILAGFGQAGIGMGIMHDANHGSFSRNRKVNKIMGYTMNLIGANANLWKIQHNVLHHTYPNVDSVDEDISVPIVMRISPHAKRYWLHRFQHYYAWLLYGFSTLSWALSKDFKNVFRYSKMGFLKGKNRATWEFVKVTSWKVVYFSYTLIIPLIVLPFDIWIIVLAFLSMHFVTGFTLTLIFQVAHVMPSAKFPLPDENGLIAGDWTVHQLATTSNFAPKSRLFSWFIGGLNYQVEHHLLPDICHVHYRKLSEIVSKTAKEYGIPYLTKTTFVAALWDHIKMLRTLGKMEFHPQAG